MITQILMWADPDPHSAGAHLEPGFQTETKFFCCRTTKKPAAEPPWLKEGTGERGFFGPGLAG